MVWILLFILIFLVSTLVCTTFKILWDNLDEGTYWPIICGFAIAAFWILALFIACNH